VGAIFRYAHWEPKLIFPVGEIDAGLTSIFFVWIQSWPITILFVRFKTLTCFEVRPLRRQEGLNVTGHFVHKRNTTCRVTCE
jgi:hypothetical protein